MSMKFNEPDVNEINFEDGKKRVLILGNGISRLNYLSFIDGWKAEIWGCNNIFRELDNGMLHHLDMLTGDKKALKDALRFKKEHECTYTVLARSMATFGIPGTERIDIPDKYVYDSGTTLVCRALMKKYHEIYLVGFDLGGPDIYVDGHENRNKSSWIYRWRIISRDFGLDKIIFIGRDHKEFILSDQPTDTYAKLYMSGRDHLTADPLEIPRTSKDVMILGNGKSRLDCENIIHNWQQELWVCNEAYHEAKKFRHITRVCSVHSNMIREAYDFKVNNKLDYKLLGRYKIPELPEGEYYQFRDKHGWSTGSLAVSQAILEDYQSILLLGFDFGGPDVYKDYDVEGSNFQKQFIELKRMYPQQFKKKVQFVGKAPEFLS